MPKASSATSKAVVISDTTNQANQANQANQLEHDQLTSLISSMADGVLAVDRFTNIIVYNGAALNILDINQSVINKPLNKIIQLVDNNNQPVDVLEYVRSIKISSVDESLKLLYQDGSTINLFLSVSPVSRSYNVGEQPSSGGYVIVLRDITREKSLEEERNEFISVVSHELRTPIAIAEGNISNAQFVAEASNNNTPIYNDEARAVQIKQALHDAHEQILFLAAMINDLSTLSRAERGKLVAEVEQINIYDLVNDLAESYKEQAAKKGLRIECELDPRLELLASSRLYVREVLQNFVTNAVKYTETGSVTISAKPLENSSNNSSTAGGAHSSSGVVFIIRDTGIGISHGDQEKIFDKFFRSEDFRTRHNNGTGLGLYITMKLARILHAEIEVSSRLNHGSTFTISIPNLQ